MLEKNRMGWEIGLSRCKLLDLKDILHISCPSPLFYSKVAEDQTGELYCI